MQLSDILLSLIAFLIAVVGFFIRKEISVFSARLDKHDDILIKLVGDVQRLIGYYYGSETYGGIDGRHKREME